MLVDVIDVYPIIIILLATVVYIYHIKSNIVKSQNKSKFDKTYLINLNRRPDRLERFMQTYMASDMKNISILKINGVDGSEIDVNKVPLSEVAKGELKQIETTGFRSKHYQLTRGAIGCYLSHVKVWRDIIENEHAHGLIFEDDVNVPVDINEKIQKSMKDIPKDWDIILFGFHCKDCQNMNNYRKVKRFILLHCYAISNTAIVKILKTKSLFPIQQQIDSYLSELSEDILNIYTVKNPIINQNGSRTDIQMPIIKAKNVDVNSRQKVNIDV
jgi:GR25 family glycosyltransferase involved in LPS biosynthesis